MFIQVNLFNIFYGLFAITITTRLEICITILMLGVSTWRSVNISIGCSMFCVVNDGLAGLVDCLYVPEELTYMTLALPTTQSLCAL